MKFPIDNPQFSARLTAEDLTLVNELIPELLPDRDLTDNTITGREIFMQVFETAALKLRKIHASRPEDLQKIEQLESDLKLKTIVSDDLVLKSDSLKKEIERLEKFIAEKDNIIDGLKTEIALFKENLEGVQTENSQVKENFLKLEKYVPVPGEMRIVLEPFVNAALSLYAEKVRIRSKIEVTPGLILSSLFVRYITKQETEFPGFPFLISKQEIMALAKQLQNEQ